MKTKEILNARGNVIQRNAKSLTQNEIKSVLQGEFIPGFWRNCTMKNAKNAKKPNTNKNRNKKLQNTVRNQTTEKESYWNKWF